MKTWTKTKLGFEIDYNKHHVVVYKVGDYYRCSIDGAVDPYIMEHLLRYAKMDAIRECARR